MSGSHVGRAATVALVDLVCVLVFAAIGRASHGEGLGLGGLAATAGPFVVGGLVGWALLLLVPTTRVAPRRVAAGVPVWLATVVVGMLVRHATGGGVQTSFVVVTAVVLAVFLLGWRAVVAGVTRARRPVAADAQV